MLGYLILLIVMTIFFGFVEKQEQSGFLWTAVLLVLLYVFTTNFEQSLIAATLLAGAFSMVAVYSVILIDSHFAPRNIFFRLISDFDLYLANFLFQSVMRILRIIAFFVKPAIKIHNGLNTKRYQVLKKAVEKAQWRSVGEILNRADSQQRAFLIASLHDEDFTPTHYEKWVTQEPKNALAYILYGNARINAAWDIRGSGTADTVSMSRFEGFWQQLTMAQTAFYQAISLDNNDPEPFNSLITVGMGLSQGQDTLWEYFVQLIKRDRNHYFGHNSMLTALTAKWGGSEEDMFHFARKTVKNLPQGHVLYGLIPAAHIEQWLYYSMDDDDNTPQQYFRLEDNINEINAAFEAYAKGIEQPDEAGYCVLNLFAFCFYQQGDMNKTRELLKIIGENATYYPWNYYGEPFLAHIDTSL